MAEGDDASEKTQEPTQRRLDDARRRGDVAKSQDLTSWASLAGTAGALSIAGGWMTRDLAQRLIPFFDHPDAFNLHDGGAQAVVREGMFAAVPGLAVILGAGALAGAAGNLIQTGFLWSPEKIKPELSKLSPLAGFKRLFGIDGLVQFFKSVVKIALVAAIAWWSFGPHARELETLYNLEPAAILPLVAQLLKSMLIAIMSVMGVIALIDWIWQRQRFSQRMRMSREELKDEARQSEGDPHVKARQRQIRTQRARQRMMQAVPKATVVVTNPTHYAVALRYEAGENEAPVCVAKGLDKLALRIRAVAEENNVPVIEDPPLARALFAAVDVDETIPVAHYEAVAKIIGFVLGGARRRRA